jgi:hypothetical protein
LIISGNRITDELSIGMEKVLVIPIPYLTRLLVAGAERG